MKILHYIILIISAITALTACHNDELMGGQQPSGVVDNGETVTLTVSLDVPTMTQVESRSMGATPDYAELHLYLLEFDRSGSDPLNNFFVRSYEAEEESAGTSPGRVDFKVTLNKEITGKVVHLIALPKSEKLEINEPLSEGVLLPRLTTSGGNDAYWQRLEFPDGYGYIDGYGDNASFVVHSDLVKRLTMVPMVRNFASVNVSSEASGFVLEGFFVTNTASHGTVAPWNAKAGRFEPYIDESGKQTDYPTLSQNYNGILPAEAKLDDKTSGYTDEHFNEANRPMYIYELPYNSAKQAQLIIKGRFNNAESTYYKLDPGRVNPTTGVFEHYSLLRNTAYTINIKAVTTGGYNSIAAALAGSVFNNISFDIETQSMLNVSDGVNMLQVNFTTAVVTQNSTEARTLRFGFKYQKNINSNKPTQANSSITITNLKPGGEKESIENVGAVGEPDTNGWSWIDITTKAPGAELLEQVFTLIDSSTGLGRQITIISKQPWEITRNVVYGGNYDVESEFPYDKVSRYKNKVAQGVGEPLTVFFTIPDNLPSSIFPLQFELESDRQNVENNPIGALVVTSGASAFEDVVGNRIKYIVTVSWSDYNTELDEEHLTGTIIAKRDDYGTVIAGETMHCVRARLKTITANDEGETRIRISNPYFYLGTPTDNTQPGYNNLPAPTAGTKGGYVDVTFSRF